MKELLRRLHYFVNRRRLDRELAADLEVHRDLAARNGGMPLGNTLHVREEARDAWGWTWIDRFGQDLRYAARLMRKSPGFTLTAILMLAVGIGVNIAAFGFFDFMVLRPLNVREPSTLFRFHRRSPQAYSFVLPYPEMAFFRDYGKTLSSVLALNLSRVSVEGEVKRAQIHYVSSNWFSELGADAALGRLLDPAGDELPNADPVVVLGYGYWQRHFGGDPLLVGKPLRLNGKLVTIIGVASPEFTGLSLEQPDLWAPITQQPFFADGSHLLSDFSVESSGVEMWGRLRRGVTPKAASEELRALAAELRRAHPKDVWDGESIPGEPGGYAESLLIGGRRGTGAEERDNIYPIAALVGTLSLLILAVACGNLGSLLLARGVARDREIGIRVAVGAGRGRLIRQLFTESLLLALLGSVAGLFVGYAVLRSLMIGAGSPAWLNATPDWRVIAFALGMAFAAAMLFGLTPALQVARQRHRATTMRQLLIGAQVAASCVLLIVAALLVRAFDHAVSAPAGFEYRQVVSIDPDLGSHAFSLSQAQSYLENLRSRLLQLPGVEVVSFATSPPFGNRTSTARVEVDGRAAEMAINQVDPQFFQTMKIPLLRGRDLAAAEARAVIVSQSLAQRLWPGEDPLGKPFPLGAPQPTVVGITGNARMIKPEDPDLAEVYYAATPADLPGIVVLLRTSAAPDGLAPIIVSIAKAVDTEVTPTVEMVGSTLRRKLQAAEYGAMAVSVLGLAALLLACAGIVGIVGYAVSQRTKEIGIRMALGAAPGNVLSVVLHQFSRPVLAGLVVGVGGAAALSQVLRRVLYGVSNLDPLAYLSAIAIFAFAVALAALLPAVRALRIDPTGALRCD